MSKETVKQAISETIVSNGKRGISAQSLSNVLNLMVDEGGLGGSGAMMIRMGTFTDTSSEMIIPVLTAEDREYNKTLFDTVKAGAEKGEGCPQLCIDYLALLGAAEPDMALMFAGSSFMLFSTMSGYLGGVLGAQLAAEIGYSELVMSMFAEDGLMVMLAPDGTVIFGG